MRNRLFSPTHIPFKPTIEKKTVKKLRYTNIRSCKFDKDSIERVVRRQKSSDPKDTIANYFSRQNSDKTVFSSLLF